VSQQRKDEFNLRDFLRKHANGLTSGAIVFVALLLAGISLIASHAFTGADGLPGWLEGLGQNFGTEMCGAAITFVMIEMLLATRRAKEAEEREKERLILQMGSPINDAAIEAARQLRARGWLEDGSLRNADLGRANLQGANLKDADLQQARLSAVNLKNAELSKADLFGVNIAGANMREAFLMQANLKEAYAAGSNLRKAYLSNAVLDSANLAVVNLQGAHGVSCDQLRQVRSLRSAVLPDGTRLPNDNTWRDAFEVWCKTVEIDDSGNIVVPGPVG
jgi:hypothetical protein